MARNSPSQCFVRFILCDHVWHRLVHNIITVWRLQFCFFCIATKLLIFSIIFYLYFLYLVKYRNRPIILNNMITSTFIVNPVGNHLILSFQWDVFAWFRAALSNLVALRHMWRQARFYEHWNMCCFWILHS